MRRLRLSKVDPVSKLCQCDPTWSDSFGENNILRLFLEQCKLCSCTEGVSTLLFHTQVAICCTLFISCLENQQQEYYVNGCSCCFFCPYCSSLCLFFCTSIIFNNCAPTSHARHSQYVNRRQAMFTEHCATSCTTVMIIPFIHCTVFESIVMQTVIWCFSVIQCLCLQSHLSARFQLLCFSCW